MAADSPVGVLSARTRLIRGLSGTIMGLYPESNEREEPDFFDFDFDFDFDLARLEEEEEEEPARGEGELPPRLDEDPDPFMLSERRWGQKSRVFRKKGLVTPRMTAPIP